MKDFYEELKSQDKYASILKRLSPEELVVVDARLKAFSRLAQDAVGQIVAGIGNSTFTEEEIARAIKDKTGTRE